MTDEELSPERAELLTLRARIVVVNELRWLLWKPCI